AVGARLALQFVQCFCVGVPHSAQNFALAATGLWQLAHSSVAAWSWSTGACEVWVGGGGGGARPGGWPYPWPAPPQPGAGGGGGGGGGGLYGAWAGACIIWPAMPMPVAKNMGATPSPPLAMPSPAPCRASAWAACRKPPASRLYAVSPASFFSRALSSSSRLMSRLPRRWVGRPEASR